MSNNLINYTRYLFLLLPGLILVSAAKVMIIFGFLLFDILFGVILFTASILEIWVKVKHCTNAFIQSKAA